MFLFRPAFKIFSFLFFVGADALVILWNASTAEAKIEIPFPDIIYSVSFNYDGSLFACTCKDKITRVVDPRQGEVVAEGMTHAGIKPQQCVFLKGGVVFTTGFSKTARRQYALWKQVIFSWAILWDSDKMWKTCACVLSVSRTTWPTPLEMCKSWIRATVYNFRSTTSTQTLSTCAER